MNILALDLGSLTGYCYGRGDEPHVQCGTWKLAVKKEVTQWGLARLDRRQDPRVLRLRDHLRRLRSVHQFDVVLFEDVQFASTVKQVQLWSSLRAAVWLSFVKHGDEPAPWLDCLATGKLKVFATGSGSADKAAMERALYTLPHSRMFYAGRDLDDNAVDAAHLWRWGQTAFSRQLTATTNP